MTLFPVEPVKAKTRHKPVRAIKGQTRLYKITYGTMQAYTRAHDADGALQDWIQKGHHPGWMESTLREEAVVREVAQDELDALADTDPKLLSRLRSL